MVQRHVGAVAASQGGGTTELCWGLSVEEGFYGKGTLVFLVSKMLSVCREKIALVCGLSFE